MENLKLSASKRDFIGKKVNVLRKQGIIPVVLYGHKVESQSLSVDYRDFEKVFKEAGESTLINFSVDGQAPTKVLIQDVAVDPVKGSFLHVDFYQVNMDEKLKAHIELKFIGESEAVKSFGGVLVITVDTVEVECLPKDLIHQIEVDLSVLKTFEDSIHVSDLKMPAGVVAMAPADEVIALIQPPRTDKEMADLEQKSEAAQAVAEETPATDKDAAADKSEEK